MNKIKATIEAKYGSIMELSRLSGRGDRTIRSIFKAKMPHRKNLEFLATWTGLSVERVIELIRDEQK